MIEIKLNSNRIYLYDSIHELPEVRFHEFNKYALMDMGVGSDMDSIGRHFANLDNLLKFKKFDEMVQERKNMHLNYFYAIEKISFKSLCFGVLVSKINQEYTGAFTFEALQAQSQRLSQMGLTNKLVTATLEDIKKKLSQSFGLTFPVDMEVMMS